MDLTLNNLQDKLEEKLKSLKKSLHAFMARVLAINQMLMGLAWYECTLWGGSDKDLKALEPTIVDFLWVGQKESVKPMGRSEHVVSAKKEGRVGLIPFVTQVQSFPEKVILFAMEEIEELHPL